MRSVDKWRPTRLVRVERTGGFKVNRKGTFGGSIYMAERQLSHYLPLFNAHLSGSLLDLGCGPVPYYELYRPLVSENICVDYPGSPYSTEFLDHAVDLNAVERLPFPDGRFDSVLASDMLAHMHRPDALMREIARVLRPGGKAIITAAFINWMGEYPYEYSHQSGPGLKQLAAGASLEILHLESYGGHADVLMDTLNKFMHTGISNRLFLAFASLVERTGWPERNRQRTKDRYALGNALVVRKP